jgi:hypothetical protein
MGVAMRLAHLFARRPEKGAETLVWLADSPDVASVSGGYFVDKQLVRSSRAAQDVESAHRLWQLSEAYSAAPTGSGTML